MKTQAICLGLAIVLIWPVATAQWVQQNSGTMNDLFAVSFANASTGVVVGDLGTVLWTTDGGSTWTSQQSGTTQALRGVSMADSYQGTAVGNSGVILHTTNGGATWMTQSSGTTVSLLAVSFANANIGIVTGDSGTILRTTNGGETWTSQPSATLQCLTSICFTDTNNGTAVGGYPSAPGSFELTGVILQTKDGGVHWWNVLGYTFQVGPLRGVSLTDVNNGVCVGAWDLGQMYSLIDGIFLRTTDGGSSWYISGGPLSAGGYGVSFADANNGIVLGTVSIFKSPYPAIYRTTDAGQTWSRQDTSFVPLNAVCMTDGQTGTVVGAEGTILHTTNGGATWVERDQHSDVPNTYALNQNYPNPFNPSTTITYTMQKASDVNLTVHDMLGREVCVLVNERRDAGVHEVKFDASGLSSGVYLYRLQAGDFVASKKLMVLR